MQFKLVVFCIVVVIGGLISAVTNISPYDIFGIFAFVIALSTWSDLKFMELILESMEKEKKRANQ
jgi:Na+/H+-dicarboxylate symporter